MKTLPLIFLLLANFCYASKIDEAWKALESNDKAAARELFNEAINNKEHMEEASLALILLNTFEGKGKNMELMQNLLPHLETPSPYLYALWFNEAVAVNYSKKEKNRVQFLIDIEKNESFHPTIKGGAAYNLYHHYVAAGDYKKSKEVIKLIHALRNWQFVGPFNNTSGSGFDKEYGPIANPNPEAVFKSKTNSNISWFHPTNLQPDAWISPQNHITTNEAVVYYQTYIDNPASKKVFITLGGAGSFKLWVNNTLIFSREKENVTEMDYHIKQIELPSGNNRVLVQQGYTNDVSYPAFLVRILDEEMNPIQNIVETNTENNNYNTNPIKILKEVPHFSETYFKEKVKENPESLIHKLLLAKAYYRSSKYNEAIDVLDVAMEGYPQNVLLHYEMILNYMKLSDRTQMLKQVERLREVDENNLFFASYDFDMAYKQKNYQEAEEKLAVLKGFLGADDLSYIHEDIKLLSAKQKYKEMMDAIEKGYKLYPENATMVEYKYLIDKSTNQSSNTSLKILEKHLDDNYSYKIYNKLLEEYNSNGFISKSEKLVGNFLEEFPDEPKYINSLANIYYKQNDYNSALKIIDKALKNAPYYSSYWHSRAIINESLGNKEEAIEDLSKAIHHNPNLFKAREKRRELEGKPTLESYFNNESIYDTINAALKREPETEDNYSYLLKEYDYVVFPEGAYTEYGMIVIKVNNETGVNDWKEAQISYNSSSQSLIVDKAETIKANGQKILAERSGGQLVFPSLEPGDVLLVDYRIDNYIGGALGKEFWGSNTFNAFYPVKQSVLRILAPKTLSLNFKGTADMEPVLKEESEFTIYEWVVSNPEMAKSEYNMPTMDEAGLTLTYSSIPEWAIIADWYQDIAMPQTREDYNLNQIFDEIFREKNYESEFDSAKAIYEYMCNNIRYSSVSFRQSNFTPQKPMVTISTQLGDCKDLSALYHALAKKAGISTNLVLVKTRDEGEGSMRLPSIDFNHCIVRIDLDGEIIYQELTDQYLPFGSLPNGVVNAQALIIPNNEAVNLPDTLIHIPNNKITQDKLTRKVKINISEDGAIKVESDLLAEGANARDYRNYFSGLTQQEIGESVLNVMSNYFEGDIKVDTFEMKNLKTLETNFNLLTTLKVDDEVKKLGGIKALKVPFFEKIASLDDFPDEERVNPFNAWLYESNDYYDLEITVQIPEKINLIEIPKGFSIKNKYIDYNLSVTAPNNNQIVFTRKVIPNTIVFPAADYNEIRETVKKIVKAEDIYLTFK